MPLEKNQEKTKSKKTEKVPLVKKEPVEEVPPTPPTPTPNAVAAPTPVKMEPVKETVEEESFKRETRSQRG